jgi:Bax protein
MADTASSLLCDEKKEVTELSRLGEDFLTTFREAVLYKRVLMVGAICACLSLAVIGRSHLPGYLAGTDPQIAIDPLSIASEEELLLRRISSTEQLLLELKANSLWEIPVDQQWVKPVFFANYPSDISRLDVETRKRVFLHALLPAILLVQTEVEKEREVLEGILTKYEAPGGLVFSEEETAWQERLTNPEIAFIDHLTGKYRSERVSDLLARVDTLPVSLIMAQAAMESSWGSSRFARKGNNLFGLWTWGERGLVPTERTEGKNHKVAVYDSILGSTRAYLLTLNRLPAYSQLRQLRQSTRDPLLLAEGLLLYSERREAYVAELKSIIRFNQLERFDHYGLAGEFPAVAAENIKVSRLP